MNIRFIFQILICSILNTSPFLFGEKNLNQIQFELESIPKIDQKAEKLAQQLGGGIYDSELKATLPFSPADVRTEWLETKNKIADRIAPVYPEPDESCYQWRNSAHSFHSLLEDAQTAAPYFKSKCLEIAKKTHAVANFGIKNQALVKSKKSLLRKVKQLMHKEGNTKEEIISKIRDALRGTMIVDNPEQIEEVMQAIREFAEKEQREVVFIDMWKDDRPTGYVGVHAAMLFPIYDAGKLTDRNIMIEIQIHLRCIMDGSKDSAKERAYLLYDQMKNSGIDEDSLEAASTLLFLTGLKDCPAESQL